MPVLNLLSRASLPPSSHPSLAFLLPCSVLCLGCSELPLLFSQNLSGSCCILLDGAPFRIPVKSFPYIVCNKMWVPLGAKWQPLCGFIPTTIALVAPGTRGTTVNVNLPDENTLVTVTSKQHGSSPAEGERLTPSNPTLKGARETFLRTSSKTAQGHCPLPPFASCVAHGLTAPSRELSCVLKTPFSTRLSSPVGFTNFQIPMLLQSPQMCTKASSFAKSLESISK